jgi:hypothetical protein
MSAIPPKADIRHRDRHVRFVPKADILPCGNYSIASLARPSSGSGKAMAERLEVGDHHCLLNGQVCRLCTFKSLEFRNRRVTHAVMIGKSDFEQSSKRF